MRRHAKLLGYGADFTILDREDSKDMLDACVAEAGINTKEERFPKGDVLADIYSLAVNTDRSIEKVLAEQYDYFSHLARADPDASESLSRPEAQGERDGL